MNVNSNHICLQKKYLELLKGSLLNEFYLENEVRLLYIFAMLESGQRVDAEIIREIGRRLPQWVDRARASRQEGKPWWSVTLNANTPQEKSLNLRNVCEFSHTMVGRKRLNNIEGCLDVIRTENIPGDLIETGVWRGGRAFLCVAISAHGRCQIVRFG